MSLPSTAGVTRIQSYEIPVETPKAPGQAKAEAVRVLGRLEQLEKAVAQDSVREVNPLYLISGCLPKSTCLFQTLRRKRDMDPIEEEQDFAFNNLVYTELGSGETGLQYENVGNENSHKYENVGQDGAKYENVDDHSRYENVSDTDPVRPCYQNVYNTAENQKGKNPEENQNVYENVGTEDVKPDNSHCEHYENYDFGENGVYQNILFTTKAASQPDADVYSQLRTLKEAVSRVNDILMKESTDCDDNKASQSNSIEQVVSDDVKENRLDKAEEIQSRQISEESKAKGKVSAIRDMFTFGKSKEPTREEPSKGKPKQQREKSEPSSTIPVGRPASMFRRWPLARAEHPVIDVERMEEERNKPAAIFSSTEREIVAKFLENVKSELSTV